MMWVLGVIAIAIIACGTFLASGRLGGMPELVEDNPMPRLPAGDLSAEDVRALRFARSLQGYAPHQVDLLMRQVADDLEVPSTRPLRAADLHSAVFDVVARGYHMGQVDGAMERLGEQLDQRLILTPDAVARDGDETSASSASTGAFEADAE